MTLKGYLGVAGSFGRVKDSKYQSLYCMFTKFFLANSFKAVISPFKDGFADPRPLVCGT